MTLSDINNRITFLSESTVTDYTYLNRTISLNKWYNQIHTWILQAQDEWDYDDNTNNDFPIATANMVANQQDYALPSSLLKVKRVELSYDGGSTWNLASPLEVGTLANTTDATTINGNFDSGAPYYDLQSNSLMLYPIPTANSTAGIKLFYDRTINAYAYTSESSNDILTGTKTPGFDSTFHDLLALGVAYDWKSAKLKDKSLMQDIMAMKADLQNHYGSKQKDRQYSLGTSYVDYE